MFVDHCVMRKMSVQIYACLNRITIGKWKWCDIQPNMVTNTLNLCSAFTHPSANTQQWTHIPWTHTQSSGQPFMLQRPGSSRGFGTLLKGTSSWYWRWRESAPPPRVKLATFWLWVRLSTIRPWLPTWLPKKCNGIGQYVLCERSHIKCECFYIILTETGLLDNFLIASWAVVNSWRASALRV